MGLEEKPEDFGQTLATWGVNAGPYVMLPLLGPSTLRDAVGFGVEVAGDPVGLAVKEYSGLSSTQRLAIPAMEAIDLRAQLIRSEEHTSELQSLMRISSAVFCLKKKTKILFTTSHNANPQ